VAEDRASCCCFEGGSFGAREDRVAETGASYCCFGGDGFGVREECAVGTPVSSALKPVCQAQVMVQVEPSASVSPSLSSQPGVRMSSSPSVSSGPSVSSVPRVGSQPSASSWPASDCNDSGILRQHTNITILSEGIKCSNGVSAASRCFHLANEGCALERIVDTVAFGVAQRDVTAWPR
jgi:hypothetical protein